MRVLPYLCTLALSVSVVSPCSAEAGLSLGRLNVFRCLGLFQDEILSDLDRQALDHYTFTGWDYNLLLNNPYRSAHGFEELALNSPKEEVLGDITKLSTALKKLPSYDGTVFRMIGIEDELIRLKYGVGEEVVEPGFVSATTSLSGIPDTYLKSSRKQKGPYVRDADSTRERPVLFTIHTVSGKDIKRYSARPQEREILIDKGTRFRVKSVDDMGYAMKIELVEISSAYVERKP